MSAPEKESLEIYTVTFHPPSDSWLGSARHHDLRVDLARAALDAIETAGPRPLIAFPAGFLRAATVATRDKLAAAMLELSRRADVGLAFGVDLSSDETWPPLAEPTRSFGYLCEAGQPKLWTVEQVRGKTTRRGQVVGPRCVDVCGMRVGLVVASEVFNGGVRKAVAARRAEVIVLLTHLGASERWAPALEELSGVAPVMIAGATPEEQLPLWAQRARGWIVEEMAQSRNMSVRRHRRIAVDPQFAVVDEEPRAES